MQHVHCFNLVKCVVSNSVFKEAVEKLSWMQHMVAILGCPVGDWFQAHCAS